MIVGDDEEVIFVLIVREEDNAQTKMRSQARR